MCAGAALAAAVGVDARVVEWDRTPIPVVLEVGVEQQLDFGGAAAVGLPADLAESGALAVQFANRTAYWRASEPFGRRRLVVRLDATGEFVLFDVEAVSSGGLAAGTAEPLEVVVARPESGSGRARGGAREEARDGLVGLIRHAARVEVAPARLSVAPEGVIELDAPVRDVTALYGHPDRGRVTLTARRQWTAGGLYVTTVEAVNWGERPLALDVRYFGHRADGVRSPASGDGFLAVGTVRYRMEPAGEEGSSTSLYVVTKGPFGREVAL